MCEPETHLNRPRHGNHPRFQSTAGKTSRGRRRYQRGVRHQADEVYVVSAEGIKTFWGTKTGGDLFNRGGVGRVNKWILARCFVSWNKGSRPIKCAVCMETFWVSVQSLYRTKFRIHKMKSGALWEMLSRGQLKQSVFCMNTPNRNQNHQNQTPELDLHVWVNCSFKRVCSVTQEILKFEPSTFKYSDLKK